MSVARARNTLIAFALTFPLFFWESSAYQRFLELCPSTILFAPKNKQYAIA
jgi:hypothetical protein